LLRRPVVVLVVVVVGFGSFGFELPLLFLFRDCP